MTPSTEPKQVLALSGGKDSTCLALVLAEREPGLDVQYIFTPTKRELPSLFAHIADLERRLGKPIKDISIGKSLYDLIDEMKMLPSHAARWCTRILKIEPAIAYMQALPEGSVLHVGLRADEEERRGIFGEDIKCRFYLREIGFGEKDVWQFLNERGVCIPDRTDCGECYDQRIIEWFYLWRDHPELYWEASAKEDQHGHTFRSPGRDTWPASLKEMAVEFERGRKIRGQSQYEASKATRCRVCSL